MSKITVIDSIMGSGKTSYAIKYMTEAPLRKRFIYITPFLKEVSRIIERTSGYCDFAEPTNGNNERSKLRSLKDLILENKNIASTHALFKTADDELIDLLKAGNYTLILDEVMDVVEPVNIIPGDIRKLIEWGCIRVEGNRVIWNDESYEGERYADIKMYAKAGSLFIYRDKFILWSFPPRVFKAFDDVHILTYLFKAQTMSLYFQLYGMEYDIVSIRDGGIVKHDVKGENRGELIKLIDLYDGPLNDTANHFAYSASWLRRKKERDAEALVQIKRNMYNYLSNKIKAPKNAIMWATLKEVESYFHGKGFKGMNISVNERATNEYADRWALAYIFNRFKNPYETSFFEDNGIKVNEDLLAVSDLLQWIWRSRIRNGQPVNLYLPSGRMRSLLIAWARYEI